MNVLITKSPKKRQQPKIPFRAKAEAYAEHCLNGKCINEVAKELYEEYGLPEPKSGLRVFGAFVNGFKKKVKAGDLETIEILKDIGLIIDDSEMTDIEQDGLEFNEIDETESGNDDADADDEEYPYALQ